MTSIDSTDSRLKKATKFNVKLNGSPTSVTLKNDIIALWILMLDYKAEDKKDLLMEFIHEQCLPRWSKHHGRGLSEFISMCMIRSFLDKNDFFAWRKIYKSL